MSLYDDELDAASSSGLLLKDLPPAPHHAHGISINDTDKSKSSLSSSYYATAPAHSYAQRLYELEDRSLHSALSAHLTGDCSHPKRLTLLVQCVSGVLILLAALLLPFQTRAHLHSPSTPPHSGEGDNGFGRSWLSFLCLFHAAHQFALSYSNSATLELQSHDIEYYSHDLSGALAWLFGGCGLLARLCLAWDVLRAHGKDMGVGALFLLLLGGAVLLLYFFYAYRSSFSSTVAAISQAVLDVIVALALLHAAALNHVAPGAAIGAAVALWIHAIVVYPMMCVSSLDSYIWLLECANLLIWGWLILCYQAFDNCVV